MLDPWLNTNWTRDDLRHVADLLPQTLVRLAALNIGLWVDGDAVRTDSPIGQRLGNAVRLIETKLLTLLREHTPTSALPTQYDAGALFDAAIVFATGIRAADENDLDTQPGAPSWLMAVARAIMAERAASGRCGG